MRIRLGSTSQSSGRHLGVKGCRRGNWPSAVRPSDVGKVDDAIAAFFSVRRRWQMRRIDATMTMTRTTEMTAIIIATVDDDPDDPDPVPPSRADGAARERERVRVSRETYFL